MSQNILREDGTVDSDVMKDVAADIENFVSWFVINPGDVRVNWWEERSAIQMEIKAAKEDMGRIIGPKGAHIHMIRRLVEQMGNVHRIKMYINPPAEDGKYANNADSGKQSFVKKDKEQKINRQDTAA